MVNAPAASAIPHKRSKLIHNPHGYESFKFDIEPMPQINLATVVKNPATIKMISIVQLKEIVGEDVLFSEFIGSSPLLADQSSPGI